MGRNSGTGSAITIVVAFFERNTWTQAELARHVDIGVPALKRRLLELQRAGVPLVDERDHPHVYWSVPKGWVPDGVYFESALVPSLLRVLARAPADSVRDALVERILQVRNGPRLSEAPSAVVASVLHEQEEQWLPLAEDAARTRHALHLRYLSAARNELEWREISPHRVEIGPPARIYATCHHSGKLKTFRVDRITSGRALTKADYRPVKADELTAFVATSVNGFRAPEAPMPIAFFVRDPEARWVASNLPKGLHAQRTPHGIEVSATVAALVQVARFVVGLGGAATVETPQLRAVVRDLAAEALQANAVPEQPRSPTYSVGVDGEEATDRH